MERVGTDVQIIINERLRELIERAGNVTAFARSIGVSRDTVNNWLFGKSDIRVNDLLKIRERYNVSVDWLLGLADHETVNKDIQTAIAVTGLTESAIMALQDISAEDAEVVSKLLVTDSFYGLIMGLETLQEDTQMLYEKITKSPDSYGYYTNAAEAEDMKPFLELRLLKSYSKDIRLERFELAEIFSRLIDEIVPTQEVVSKVEKMNNLYGSLFDEHLYKHAQQKEDEHGQH